MDLAKELELAQTTPKSTFTQDELTDIAKTLSDAISTASHVAKEHKNPEELMVQENRSPPNKGLDCLQ